MSRVLVYYHYTDGESFCFTVSPGGNLYALLADAAGTMQNVHELTPRQEKAHAYCNLRCASASGSSFEDSYYKELDAHFGSKAKAESIFDLGADKVEGRQAVADLYLSEIFHLHFAS